MPERIDFTNIGNPSIFAIEAILLSESLGADIPGYFENKYVDVELKINGVEVPFKKAVDHIAKQLNDDVDRRAAELATAKAFDGLLSLTRVVERVKEELCHKTQEVFGVELDY